MMFLVFASLCATYAWGADSAYCKKYAEEAVGQYYLAKYHHIPGINPPAWQMDYEAHKKWCELPMIPRALAEIETYNRKKYIDDFFQKQNLENQSQCEVKKKILPDGSVEIYYNDGTIKTITDKGIFIKYPDGHIKNIHSGFSVYMNVQPAAMPKEPATPEENRWLLSHAEKLLDVIQTQVQDREIFENYIRYEDDNLSVFEKIEKRSLTIKYLASP
jgi:hypothetical protein